MKYVKMSLILLLISSMFYSCKKISLLPEKKKTELDEYGLPTLEGNTVNIFACLVNGDPWVSEVRTSGLIGGAPRASYYESTRKLTVGGSIRKERPYDISSIASSIKLGNFEPNIYYPLRDSLEGGGGSNKPLTFCRYPYKKMIDPDFNYIEIMEMDTGTWKRVKGRFQMKLINDRDEGCTDTLVITQGRFQMPYQHVY